MVDGKVERKNKFVFWQMSEKEKERKMGVNNWDKKLVWGPPILFLSKMERT